MTILRPKESDEEAFVKNVKFNALHDLFVNSLGGSLTGLGAGATAGLIYGAKGGKAAGGLGGSILGAGLGTVLGAGVGAFGGGSLSALLSGKLRRILKDNDKLKSIFKGLGEEEKKTLMPQIRNENDLFETFGYTYDEKSGDVDLDPEKAEKQGTLMMMGKNNPVDPKKLSKNFSKEADRLYEQDLREAIERGGANIRSGSARIGATTGALTSKLAGGNTEDGFIFAGLGTIAGALAGKRKAKAAAEQRELELEEHLKKYRKLSEEDKKLYRDRFYRKQQEARDDRNYATMRSIRRRQGIFGSRRLGALGII